MMIMLMMVASIGTMMMIIIMIMEMMTMKMIMVITITIVTCILLCLIPSVSGYVQLTIASKSIGSSRSTAAMTMDLFSGSPRATDDTMKKIATMHPAVEKTCYDNHMNHGSE
jgi:hypothetical protein